MTMSLSLKFEFLVSYKMKVGLCYNHALCVSMKAPTPTINIWMPEPICMKSGIYIMALEPISMAYFINLSHLSSCLSYLC
jgi:hypothetical protein